MIAHARLAAECQVPQPVVIENGDLVRLASGSAAIVDTLPVGRLASDGKSLLPLDGAVLQERRRAGIGGTALASLVLDRRGRLAAPPAASLIGVVEDASEAAAPFLRSAIERALVDMPAGQRHDDAAVREAVRRALRRALNERFGKRPLIEIHLVRIKGEER
jgi:ribonuclease J